MSTRLSNPTVMVNNVQVAVKPNSVVYDDGLGEQKMTAASTGGGGVEIVYSDDIESNLGMVKFEMPANVGNADLVRSWKVAKNTNLVQIMGGTSEGNLTRTFQNAAILNRVEVPLGSDADIPVEFSSDPAI